MTQSAKTAGGKTVYGASVGILMLETRFPRIPGDMGNAGTWPFPVLYKVVRGASPDHVVRREDQTHRIGIMVKQHLGGVADAGRGIPPDRLSYLAEFRSNDSGRAY